MSQRTWEYVEPGEDGRAVVYRLTDADILGSWWDWWSGEMRRQGMRGINPERCIQDWVVVNWASEVCAQ
jgi:hypothetical protein